MKQDQLEKARQTRWRQDGNALLTLDDAERWLRETPLCLYLPRYQHMPVPAPSFVEAVAGRSNITPTPDEIAAASHMLARLVASGAVIALNLFGAAPGIGISSFVGEHPDFIATPEALPYLYALQPERNPKRPPTTVGGARVSPLAAEAYKVLEREGALTTIELRSRLGREVTEAAVLRSLAELWHTMRVVPVPAENGPEGAHWELLSARHRRELNMGSTQSQGTALSILASFYLQSAVAATGEQVEIFLSPLASRSRIRDVVHGLSATRQLASFPLNGEEQFYVEGTLPEIAEEEETAATPLAGAAETIQLDASVDAGLEQNEPSFAEAGAGSSSHAAQARRSGPASPTVRAVASPRAKNTKANVRNAAKADSAARSEAGIEHSEQDQRVPREPPGHHGQTSSGAAVPVLHRNVQIVRIARIAPVASHAVALPVLVLPGVGSASPRGGFERRGSFGKDRPPRPAGGGFRRARPSGDRPPRTGEGAGRSAPGGRPPFRQGRPSAGSGERPSRPFRKPSSGEGRSSFPPNRPSGAGRPSGPGRSFGPGRGSGPDRPFRKPSGDRPAGGPRRFDSRPPRRDGPSRPPGDRPFKRPYSPRGDRPQGRPAASRDVPPGVSSSGERPERAFTPRPTSRPPYPPGPSGPARPQGGERERRPFSPGGQRPGRPGGFSKPGAPGPAPSVNPASASRASASHPATGRPRVVIGQTVHVLRVPPLVQGRGLLVRQRAETQPPVRANPVVSGNRALPASPLASRDPPAKAAPPPRPAPASRVAPAASQRRVRQAEARRKRAVSSPAASNPVVSSPKCQRPGGSAPPKRKPRGESREGGEG